MNCLWGNRRQQSNESNSVDLALTGASGLESDVKLTMRDMLYILTAILWDVMWIGQDTIILTREDWDGFNNASRHDKVWLTTTFVPGICTILVALRIHKWWKARRRVMRDALASNAVL
ncbi:hypothetical protein G7Z17_g13137 [Cylindrodendrum hubeiense]|uniref:Uncharacterized protein n=1 Tax=Cylindrodendrum hubeiense TaxID=595255 RepID=A0A9P5GZI4_9HYPO|nr:hypothetical protein G7Z17_g13137 [Cylindrodendrum hubeiense]